MNRVLNQTLTNSAIAPVHLILFENMEVVSTEFIHLLFITTALKIVYWLEHLEGLGSVLKKIQIQIF